MYFSYLVLSSLSQNGVKQGGVLSPILFSISISCALTYADDLSLFGSSLSGLPLFLNLVKSKLECFNYFASDKTCLTLCDKSVDVVNNVYI